MANRKTHGTKVKKPTFEVRDLYGVLRALFGSEQIVVDDFSLAEKAAVKHLVSLKIGVKMCTKKMCMLDEDLG